MISEFEARVTDITDYCDGGKCTFKIVTLKRPPGFSFVPGQFAMLATDSFRLWGNPNQMKWTSMSICSAPEDTEHLEFCIAIKDTPGFSMHIADHLQVGDTMFVKGPLGNFLLAPTADESVFVATGAGIAPIMSMIRTLMGNGYRKPVALFFGFRTGNQFLYQEELEQFATRENFTLHTTVSREDPAWKGRRGYVQGLLQNLRFQDAAGAHIYICGNPAMVADVRKMMQAKGLTEEQIHREQW